jgi:VWFA-related protein
MKPASRAPALLAATLMTAGTPASPTHGQSAAQFRTVVTGVAVPVIVRAGREPVTDLAPDEFVLTDSGVRQQVSAVRGATVPIDLSLIVERSEASEFLRSGYQAEMGAVTEALAPADRVRVVHVAEDVWEVTPLSSPETADRMRDSPRSAGVALYDALAAFLIRPVEPGRQHVVVALSRGVDTLSIVSADRLLDLAQRSEGFLHVLVTESTTMGTRTVARLPVGMHALWDWSEGHRQELRAIASRRGDAYWDGVWNASRRKLVAVAEATGGGEIAARAFSGSIGGPVRRVLEEVRSSYILYYQPAGVPEGGWHPIEVSVARPGRFDVRARPGYTR